MSPSQLLLITFDQLKRSRKDDDDTCVVTTEIGLRVERIATDGDHVEILAVRIQPLLGHSWTRWLL